MSHARSGLPPLHLEPFDPTPLYAAARAPGADDRRHRHGRGHRLVRALIVVLLLALVLIGVAAAVLR